MILLLCLLLPWVALGEDNAQIVSFSTFTERVKLREQPNDTARVLGQYYGGQPVEILEDGKSWKMVSIGGRTGYMMQKYLTDLTGEAAAPEGVIRYPEADGTLPLYDQAGGTGRVIARMQGGVLQVLGTVSQEWLHVRYTSPEGERHLRLCLRPGDYLARGDKPPAGGHRRHQREAAPARRTLQVR